MVHEMSAILSCLSKIRYYWHFLFVIILIGLEIVGCVPIFLTSPHVLAMAVEYLIIQGPRSSF